jgi:hypothetical protein
VPGLHGEQMDEEVVFSSGIVLTHSRSSPKHSSVGSSVLHMDTGGCVQEKFPSNE